jgi:hypothetical protein
VITALVVETVDDFIHDFLVLSVMSSPSNSMNPFALTDEDEPSVPSSETHGRTPDEPATHKIGLTSNVGSSIDGLPIHGTGYDSIFRDQSLEDQSVEGGDDAARLQESRESSKRLEGTNGSNEDFVPPDAEIPSMVMEGSGRVDTESSGRTAEQSLYLSLRTGSNGTSKGTSRRLHEGAGRGREIDLGSSLFQMQADGKDAMPADGKWKGKAKDMSSSAESHQRGRSTDPFADDHSRTNSASPPPDLLRSRGSSVSSNGLSTNHRTMRSSDTFRDESGKGNLLPLPVTAPQGGNRHRSHPESEGHFAPNSVGNVIFNAELDIDDPPPSRKTKPDKHRHHKRRHHRPPSASTATESQYPAEEYSDDPHGMLMSARSTHTSEPSRRKRSKKRTKDPTAALSERERAMWGWANVVDLDGYLQEVSLFHHDRGW